MMGFNEVDALTLSQWKKQGDAVRLVDVRTPAEQSRGVIEGAELMPLHLVPLKTAEFDTNQRVVFYCQSGARSAQACMFMVQHGLSDVHNLQGGIMAWVGSGSAVVEPSSEALRAAG